MPVPNPIWGFHIAPGAVAGVRLRRDAPDTWTLEEEVTLLPAGGGAEAAEACVEFVQRRELDTRPLFLTLPDHTGSITIAVLTPDDLGLDAAELKLSLYSHTPFTPDEAELWHAPIEDGGIGRTHLVTAVPRSESRPAHASLAVLDPAYHGLGTSGLALLRGARTLRLLHHQQVLLELLPEATLLHAVYGRHVRRYLLRPGLNWLVARSGADSEALGRAIDAGKSLPGPVAAALTEAAGPLVRDVARVIQFHHDHLLRRLPPDADKPQQARVLLTGPLAASPAVGGPLRRALEGRVDETPPPSGDFVVRSAGGGHLSPAAAARLVGAIGAALQGFGVPDDGLALRALPQDVPEPPRKKKPVAAFVGGAVVVAAIAIAAPSLLSQDPDTTTDPETRGSDPDGAETVSYATVNGIVRERLGFVAALREVRRMLDAGGGDLGLERLALDAVEDGYHVEAVCVTSAGALPPPSAREGIERALEDGPTTSGVEMEQLGTGLRVTFLLETAEIAPPGSGEIRSRGVLQEWLGMDAEWAAGRVAGRDALLAALDSVPAGALEAGEEGSSVVRVRLDRSGAVLEALAHVRAPYVVGSARATTDAAGEVRFEIVIRGDAADPGVPVPSELPVRLADAITAAITTPLPETPFMAASAGKPAAAGLRLGAADGGPGQVTLSWPKGPVGRVIERSQGAGPWSRVTEVGSDAGGTLDHVPGATGLYRWRLGLADVSGGQWGALREVRVEVPVEVALLGPGEAPNTARMGLRRAWKGGKTEEEVTVTIGDELRVERPREGDVPLVFETFAKVASVTIETRQEPATVSVPVFDAEGRVARDEGGKPRSTERVFEVPVRYLVVEAGPDGGTPLRWARKMTSP